MIPVGTGQYRCGVAMIDRPWSAVRAWVPQRFKMPAADRWPVVWLFGEHRAVNIEGTRVPNIRYHESLVAVGGLRHPAVDEPVAWIGAMYLSRRLPVWMGLPYGFPKVRATLRGLPDAAVADDRGPIAGACFRPASSGEVEPWVNGLFDQPFITRIPVLGVDALVRMDFLPATRRVTGARCEGFWRAPTPDLAWQGPATAAWRFESRWRLHGPRMLGVT